MIAGNFLVTLKDGVEEKDFDKWIKEEWSRTLNGEGGPKGMTGQIAKGDRGPATGHYLVVIYFDSAETRAWYFPVEGEGLGAKRSTHRGLERPSTNSGTSLTSNGAAMVLL